MFDKEKCDREIKEYHERLENSSLKALETEHDENELIIERNIKRSESLDGMDTTGMTKDELDRHKIGRAHAYIDIIEGLLNRINLKCYINRKSEC